MARFTLEELRSGLDQIDTVSIPYRSENGIERGVTMGQVGKRPIEETKALIKSVIKREKRAMKFREIARSIDRKPTPHLRRILKDMIDTGELVQDVDTAIAGNMDRYWYMLP